LKGGKALRTYLRHRIWNVLDIRELIALEYLDFEGKYKNYSEQHDFWELCYLFDGEITVSLGDESRDLSAGELLLIDPDRRHSYDSSKGNLSSAFVVCFESSSQALRALAGKVFSHSDLAAACMRDIVDESAGTFKMNDEEHLEALSEPNFGGQQIIMLRLEHLLIGLLRDVSSQKNSEVVFLKDENFYSDLSKAIIKFFEEHIREELSLDDVCRKMNYSRSFLCKTFKHHTGETIMGCFNRMKVEEAARLLKETEWSVSDVAHCLGYGEAKHFGELFKRYMGMSPAKYRKMGGKEYDINRLR